MRKKGLLIGAGFIAAALAVATIFYAHEAHAQSVDNKTILDSIRGDMDELQTLLRLYEEGQIVVYGDTIITLTTTHKNAIKTRAAALRTSIRSELMDLSLD